MAIIKLRKLGYPGATLQRAEFEWDTRVGWQSRQSWKGDYGACVGLMPQLQSAGWNFKMEPEGGQNYVIHATIGLSFSGGILQDNPVDTWELTSNRVEVDLLRSNIALINGLTQGDVWAIKFYIENPPQPPAGSAPGTAPPTPILSAAALKVYNLILAGTTSIEIFQPVLRRTSTVSSQYAVAQSVAGVGTLFKTVTVKALIPNSIIIALPGDIAAFANGQGLTFVGGWYKDYPVITASAFNKTQITQDWKFGVWSQDIYGAPA